MRNFYLLLLTGFFSTFTFQFTSANEIEIFDYASPQSMVNSCQSQALMLALHLKGNPAFTYKTGAELRAAEVEFHKLLHALRQEPENRNLSIYSHQLWKKALSKFTHEKFQLDIEYIDGFLNWKKRVVEKTGNDLSTQLFRLENDIILTSVNLLGEHKYKSGHVVGVTGTNISDLSSRSKTTFFNGAIKDGAKLKVKCNPSDQLTDYKYSAGATTTSKYILKQFNGNYLLMYITRA